MNDVRLLPRPTSAAAVVLATLLALPEVCIAQNSVRQFGWCYFDTEAYRQRIIDVDVEDVHTIVLRADGHAFVNGPDLNGTCRAPQTALEAVSTSYGMSLGVTADGGIEGWGPIYGAYGPAPVAPQGLRYVAVACGYLHAILMLSDGSAIGFGSNVVGESSIPTLPAGVGFAKIVSRDSHNLALLTNGNAVAWGDNSYGQCNVPALPMGLVYTDVSAGHRHAMALRSDGTAVAWGSNPYGECNVPALPPGTVYLKIAAGRWVSVAWRSDGQLVVWGTSSYGLQATPAAPPGVTCTKLVVATCAAALWSDGSCTVWGPEDLFAGDIPRALRKNVAMPADSFVDVAAGGYHTVLLRHDGTVEACGWNGLGQCDVPALPTGLRYTKVAAGLNHSLALRSDGQVVSWGTMPNGQQVPPLPAGVVYTDIEVGLNTSLLLRSDGGLVAFGSPASGALNIPALPAGVTYVKVSGTYLRTLLLRSDGALAYCGATGTNEWPAQLPALPPPGLQWTGIAAGENLAVVLRSDGEAVLYASSPFSLPARPWGVYYVEAACGELVAWLRRSDGEIVAVRNPVPEARDLAPDLLPGTSYLQVAGESQTVAARVGPTCNYVGFAHGCAGSRPASRLVPGETPRIGRTFEVRLFDLPHDLAVLAMGWQSTPLLDLGFAGMPGCDLAISIDGAAGLAGQGNQATWSLPIPDQPGLVGVRFYQQALVLDMAAGNALGAVLSDAMLGTIGYP